MSDTDYWQTPESVLEPIQKHSGGIALDPCAGVNTKIGVTNFTEAENGLKQSWHGYRTIFVNPPYSKPNLPLWTAKCVAEANHGNEIYLLIPVFTSSSWWHKNIRGNYEAILFYERRIKFLEPNTGKPKGTPRHHSCLVYFGRDFTSFQNHFSQYGHIV
jgi:phage N-6-adenine-methyltransferase